MPKRAEPWFRASSNTWVIRRGGRLTTLARGRDSHAEAVAKWRAMDAAPAPGGVAVGVLAERFLEHVERDLATTTAVWYRRHLSAFVAFIGPQRPLASLTAADCLAWVDSTPWGPSTRRGAITAVKRLFAWGVEVGALASNPLATMKRPAMRRRERIPTTAEVWELVDGAAGATRDFLAFLAETGCRQSEACRLQRRHVDLAAGACTMHGKSTNATSRPRVIYLSAGSLVILRRRLEGLKADDFAFTTKRGHPWTLKATKDAVKGIRRRLDLPSHVTAGGIRHWWITERLRAGVPIAHVAELAGHTSTAMIARHYGHLSDHGRDLRRALERRAS